MIDEKLKSWLLDSDPAIQYQVYRDLLDTDRTDIQARIESEGWGAEYLKNRNPDGHWGLKFYQPKWTSSHYTLLEMRNLCMPRNCIPAVESVTMIAVNEKGADGGINPSGTIAQSDVCLNGMFLDYACWFGADEKLLESIADFILSQQMPDGGFNCRSNRSGAVHSSLHSSLSVCEGIAAYRKSGYSYRLEELSEAEEASAEFILRHRLFLSDRTGEIINRKFLSLSHPGRWFYNILRALDYFAGAGFDYDERMQPAIDVLIQKRGSDGRWKLGARHPGVVFFHYEQSASPSRWNTLRVLRVLRRFNLY